MHNNNNGEFRIEKNKWRFWIDRGGTFTDVVGISPEHEIKTAKLLSNNPNQYDDAAVQGIRDLLNLTSTESIPDDLVRSVKMGTTVATNALLERKGVRTALLITQGLGDILRIGYQNRPRLFDLNVKLPEVLYSSVVEVEERISAEGEILVPLNKEQSWQDLKQLHAEGFDAVAIVLMHAYRFPDHERELLEIAQKIGFRQISVSYQTSALIKLIGRGDTTVADAYLNPILQNYVKRVTKHLGNTRLFFMQSNSGLTSAQTFQGKDAILSGPAGGIVGMVKTAAMADLQKIIGFDMGGTSTDVSHYDGEYERVFETVVSGVRLRAPMMNIHTVAAGGGSILKFDGMRFTVGPESAGSTPGPACYRNNGPLTVTDCNVMLGNIRPEFFPKVFGTSHDQPIDIDVVKTKFIELAAITGKTSEDVAEGFLKIAVENMVNAIRKISVQRGYDVTEYALCCFGGAAAQHACRVADSLEMEKIFIHPLSGVLSAYGIGLADIIEMKGQSIEKKLDRDNTESLQQIFAKLENECLENLNSQGVDTERTQKSLKVHLRYAGTNTELPVDFSDFDSMVENFGKSHLKRFGFEMKDRELLVGTVSIEMSGGGESIVEPQLPKVGSHRTPESMFIKSVYLDGEYRDTAFYQREQLLPGHKIPSPAVIIETNATVLIELGWQGEISDKDHLLLTKTDSMKQAGRMNSKIPDPIRLEIFNNLFMSIAEQMGEVLANTAYSVNIKERLDFSCAVFDDSASLIANAPHMPVHLGSMGESVRAVIKKWHGNINPGDTFILNDPYGGGTHLPDITLVSPVFVDGNISFYVASRGHHADVGGITPGSMASDSCHLDEEGVLIPNLKIVDRTQFRIKEITDCLTGAKYPVRSLNQNIEDLKAQLASNEKGVTELLKAVDNFGKEVVFDYVRHVQDNAEESVRRIVAKLKSNQFKLKMDNGCHIQVSIEVNSSDRSAVVDFTGTSPQHSGNFNAPSAVCRAAVLYVFRTLVGEDIPMNEGCLRPIEIRVPSNCLLNPVYPAAVVAGNVETSQAIVDTLYGALGTVAEAQGTMNNLTFGNDRHQYYETICGGTGAGEGFDGTDAVHSHMTNSLMTDPEILELRYPVTLRRFQIRKDSGGEGKYKGGDGVIREIEFQEDMTVSILSGHRINPPYGLNGGGSGQVGANTVIRYDGTEEELQPSDKTHVKSGDRIRIQTPGGGGFGCN